MKNLTILVLVVIIVGGVFYFYSKDKTTKTVPETNQDVATPVKSTSNISLDMSNTYSKKYKTLFTSEFSKPANFSGNFRVVEAGCGSGCMYLFALDKNTGKVYKINSPQGETDPFSEWSISGNQIKTRLQNNQIKLFTFNNVTNTFE